MADEFYVDTDKLKAVAQSISNLLDSINSDDATPGTPKNFQKANSIAAPTATFWDGDNALASAYSNEWTYVNDTYAKLTQQLGLVLDACNQTVSQYANHETQSTHDINAPQNQYK